jgi:hypothetical protein
MSGDPIDAGMIWFRRAPDGPGWKGPGADPIPGPHRTLGPPSIDAVWRLLAEPRTFPDLVASVAEDAGESPDRIAPDVAAILSEFVDRGFVHAVADTED